MASEFRFFLTETARSDLEDAVSYMSVELDNAAAASRFMEKVEKAIQELCLFPESAPKVVNEYIPEMNLRKKVIDHYILYYQPDFEAKTIVILRIVYGRRDMNAILGQI